MVGIVQQAVEMGDANPCTNGGLGVRWNKGATKVPHALRAEQLNTNAPYQVHVVLMSEDGEALDRRRHTQHQQVVLQEVSGRDPLDGIRVVVGLEIDSKVVLSGCSSLTKPPRAAARNQEVAYPYSTLYLSQTLGAITGVAQKSYPLWGTAVLSTLHTVQL